MILADTSVWIDHLRKTDAELTRLLHEGLVLSHPFIIGEIALGYLKNRGEILAMLSQLSGAKVASDHEALQFIHSGGLAGSGVGYVDAHLLASAKLTPGAVIWTRDRKLKKVALALDLSKER